MKRILLSLAIVSLLAVSANAATAIQGQLLNLVAGECQTQLGGMGAQTMSNTDMASQNQMQGNWGTVQQETQTAIVAQGGDQVGICGALGQGQIASVTAAQGQVAEDACIGPVDPAQGEILTLNLGQGQGRVGGAGAQVLGQGAVVAQSQIQATPSGFQSEAQMGGGAQYAGQSGIGGAQLQTQNLTVVAGQGQNI